jgi:1,4-dihydroxy-6-naphthoate synthase
MTIGFSPCPNDTFIYERFLQEDFQNKYRFTPVITDVEELNRKAFNEELDITKLSFHAWLYLQDKYELLNSGSALGKGCGPLLIARKNYNLDEIDNLKIAIPGKYTTANFLLSARFPNLTNKQEMLFSDIENAILNNGVDAGLIIHENRFTYSEKGLVKIMDMGEWWENETQCAIPLGGIAIHKKIGITVKNEIENLLKQSIEWANNRKPIISDFVKHYSQAMHPDIMRQHIDLYVNENTLELGKDGWQAIEKMKEYFSSINTGMK